MSEGKEEEEMRTRRGREAGLVVGEGEQGLREGAEDLGEAGESWDGSHMGLEGWRGRE